MMLNSVHPQKNYAKFICYRNKLNKVAHDIFRN